MQFHILLQAGPCFYLPGIDIVGGLIKRRCQEVQLPGPMLDCRRTHSMRVQMQESGTIDPPSIGRVPNKNGLPLSRGARWKGHLCHRSMYGNNSLGQKRHKAIHAGFD